MIGQIGVLVGLVHFMDSSNAAIIYVLLVIPTLFALTVLGQGIVKFAKQKEDGPVALGFGVILVGLIAAAYWWFIR